MKLIVVSDTHGQYRKMDIPQGDVYIHCGDISMYGSPSEVQDFDAYLHDLDIPHKIVIAGNHDKYLDNGHEHARSAIQNAHYLQDDGITIDGLTFYGSPWQPSYLDMSFNLEEADLKEKWDQIPKNVDVLITHTPPYGILDKNSQGLHRGSTSLANALTTLSPKLHVFGHIHESRGCIFLDETKFVNAACCDGHYNLLSPAWALEI